MDAHLNIIFVGPTGAGKTTIGRRVARRFGKAFFDLDQEIESHTGADVALIFDIEGEKGFRQREKDMLFSLTEKTGIVLATGAGAVLDNESRQRLSARGLVVYLRTPINQQTARLSRDKRRPLLQQPNRNEILERMARERNPIYEEVADVIIDSEPKPVSVMANKVVKRLIEERAIGSCG